jgi:hypothetical protein
MIAAAKEYIAAGDIFQVVLSQRFERRTWADPFEIYRSLRIVNPSPYMIYLQARGCIMVASSPEILCRVDKDNKVSLSQRMTVAASLNDTHFPRPFSHGTSGFALLVVPGVEPPARGDTQAWRYPRRRPRPGRGLVGG